MTKYTEKETHLILQSMDKGFDIALDELDKMVLSRIIEHQEYNKKMFDNSLCCAKSCVYNLRLVRKKINSMRQEK